MSDIQEIRIHDDQSDMYDFMKEVNSSCKGCRFIQDNRCICKNTMFYSADVRDEEVEFSLCTEKYDEDDSKNFMNSDEDTGALVK